jgi:hypothetical protein
MVKACNPKTPELLSQNQPEGPTMTTPIPEQTIHDLEKTVMRYIEVLDRTCEMNVGVMPLVDASIQATLKKDNEVLLDIRNRIWKQFAPVLIDDIH